MANQARAAAFFAIRDQFENLSIKEPTLLVLEHGFHEICYALFGDIISEKEIASWPQTFALYDLVIDFMNGVARNAGVEDLYIVTQTNTPIGKTWIYYSGWLHLTFGQLSKMNEEDVAPHLTYEARQTALSVILSTYTSRHLAI